MRAAMSSGLPVRIQVQKAVANAVELDGALALSSLPRLQASLFEPDGEVNARLKFERAADGRSRLAGRLEARPVLQCQRCLGAMSYDLSADVDLLLLNGSEGEDVFEGIDVSSGELRLHDLIEDELMLALPSVAAHDRAQDCEQGEAPQSYLQREETESDKAEGTHPFAALKDLNLNKPSTR